MRNKDVALYVLSGVLFAVTIPMYRYLAHHASPSSASSSTPLTRVSSLPSDSAGLSVDRAKLAVYRSTLNDRYALRPDERCVGGAVIEVRGNVYTQLGSIAEPVHCVGRVADRPLR